MDFKIYLPIWPQAMIQVSCRCIVSWSATERNISNVFILFFRVNSVARFGPSRKPGSVRLHYCQHVNYIQDKETNPAAIRSSRIELRRDLRHQCANVEVSRSMKSGFLKCEVNLLRVIIANTLGFRASWNDWAVMMLLNTIIASLLTSFTDVGAKVLEVDVSQWEQDE